MRVFAALLGFLVAQSGPQGPEHELLDKIRSYGGRIENCQVDLACNREFLVQDQEAADDSAAPKKYQKYEYTYREAWDRGRSMFETARPRIVSGKGMIEGERDNIRQVYDGSVLILNERPNYYLISRKPEKWKGLETIVNVQIRFAEKIAGYAEAGRAVLRSSIEGDESVLECEGEEGVKFVVRTLTNKNHALRSVKIVGPEDKIYYEAAITDYVETEEGVWVPKTGSITKYREDGTPFDRDEMAVVDLKVNAPEMDPELFKMSIPPGSGIFHADLGIQMMPKEVDEMATQNILETPELIALQIEEKRTAKVEAMEQAAAQSVDTTDNTDNVASLSIFVTWVAIVAVALILAVVALACGAAHFLRKKAH
ncbi:MAG TPA: hypothetical protein HPP77_06635 [Candidatus Hydrogenedentes bacterium]|nr:hypothetical protein [Candidatus Hydrogenedentota bacterium]